MNNRSQVPSRAHHRAVLGCAFVIVAATLIFAPGAGAFIYWTHSAINSVRSTFGRANLDGSGANPRLFKAHSLVGGTAVNGSHLYWQDGSVERASLNGTRATELIPNAGGGGLAIDSRHLYFFAAGFGSTKGSIGRGNLNGTHVKRGLVKKISPGGCGLAVSRSHIFWSNNFTGTIGRATLNGTDVDQNFIKNVESSNACGVAVHSSDLYWGEDGSIGRAKLNGTDVQHNFIRTRVGAACGVAIAAGRIYWANNKTLDASIGRARLDGSHVKRKFITKVGGHHGYQCMGAVGGRSASPRG
jgi:virginiamycin B lyase